MNFRLGISTLLIAGLLAVCGPVWAHHGNSAYDEQHWITITGTVTEFVWSNPHCQIFMDVKDYKLGGRKSESGHPAAEHLDPDLRQARRPNYDHSRPRQKWSASRLFRQQNGEDRIRRWPRVKDGHPVTQPLLAVRFLQFVRLKYS
jgi:hypothetical protein